MEYDSGSLKRCPGDGPLINASLTGGKLIK